MIVSLYWLLSSLIKTNSSCALARAVLIRGEESSAVTFVNSNEDDVDSVVTEDIFERIPDVVELFVDTKLEL